MKKILFVCHGNICRSTMAEFIMKDIINRIGLEEEFFISSAATSAEEIGNPVHEGTRQKLAQKGIDTSGKRAIQLESSDYKKYDYLIGMDKQNLIEMKRICGTDCDKKLSLLMDNTKNPRNIADPWYTGDFDTTYNDVNEGCLAFLEKKLLIKR